MATMTVSEARAHLPEVLDRVDAGEEITITRHGKPAAVVLSPDTVRYRRAEAAYAGAREVHDRLERARRMPLTPGNDWGLAPGRADELVAELRAERDRD